MEDCARCSALSLVLTPERARLPHGAAGRSRGAHGLREPRRGGCQAALWTCSETEFEFDRIGKLGNSNKLYGAYFIFIRQIRNEKILNSADSKFILYYFMRILIYNRTRARTRTECLRLLVVRLLRVVRPRAHLDLVVHCERFFSTRK